ncbi:MAG: iron-containing alcohol dehydrogenase [Bacteroidales bacterium]|nr:iron-containing alcohol dehydrogenase [Candidatus Cryptobacteroides fimicaballi]
MENMYLTRKAIRKLPGSIMKTVPMPEPEIIEGFGCRSEIGRICQKSGFDTVLILTDKLLCNLGYLKAVEESLDSAGIRYRLFDGITTEPRLEYIEAGRSIALESNAKCIITIGGGSVMDTGKMVASGCRLKHLPADMLLQKFLIVPEKTLPIVAIPSTAGTGAEVTVGAVITQRKGGKFASVIVGLDVHTVFLDSELTIKAPWNITAGCGIDALSHGLEGAVADVRSSMEDIEKSRRCVRLVIENLPKLKEHPEDIAARGAMCLAANLGGNAINKQLAGYVHAFAHSIGAKYHIPHGKAIAMCLLPVMRSQMESCSGQLSELARFCNFESVDALFQALESLIDLCGLDLNGAIIAPEDFRSLSVDIAKDSVNYSAPMTFPRSQIISILSEINKHN